MNAPPFEGFAPLLQVFDMPAAVAFYRDILGFELVSSSEPRAKDDFDWGMLERDGITLMLNTAFEFDRRPFERPRERVAAHEDIGLFFACRDVDAMFAYLLSKGVAAEEPRVAPYGMKQLWLRDPDGYVICFQWRAERSGGTSAEGDPF